jgi:DNA-binding NarL/FixJ family response regulator
MTKTVKIILADDHQILTDSLRELLRTVPNFEVIGTTANGKQLLEAVKHKTPDIIILDVDMPEMGGVEASKHLKRDFPFIKILVLTMYDSIEFVIKLWENGVDGYLLKNTPGEELIEGIKNVAAGRLFFPDEILKIIRSRKENPVENSTPKLSDREKEIVCLIVQEYTSREIAAKLFIQLNTVETHRKIIFDKLGVKNVVGLVKYALNKKLCE